MPYFARICWNLERWCKPSGPYGKSTNQDTYEYNYGFGHEEWLLDTSKLLDGYHYAHLQAFDIRNREEGDWMDDREGESITLFSLERNDEGPGTWWKIGKISNISGVKAHESAMTFNRYSNNGWIEEMDRQLNTIPRGIQNPHAIDILSAEDYHGDFFNIKFSPEDIALSEEPELVTSEIILDDLQDRCRYGRLYTIPDNWEGEVVGQQRNRIPFQGELAPQEGGPQEGNPQEGGQGRLYRRKKNSKVHKQIQTAMKAQLWLEYEVKRERPIETNCSVDFAVQLGGGCEIFYEIKTSNTVKDCIREAFGQIMEYAYYPADNHEVYERAIGLVIVSQNAINDSAKRYIDKLLGFKINIYYQRFNLDMNILEDAYPSDPLASDVTCN